jgi:AcrR family transcriptional regulator
MKKPLSDAQAAKTATVKKQSKSQAGKRTVKQVQEKILPRGPGRPGKAEDISGRGILLTKAVICEAALELSRREPLDAISMVRMAREFSVTPALMHYYVGGRERLTSGVMNQYYVQLLQQLPAPTGDSRADLAGFAKTLYSFLIRYCGITDYILTNNRFRMVQEVNEDETDYGIKFFDYVASIFQRGGLEPSQAALGIHLLLQFVLVSAHSKVRHQLPADHRAYLKKKLSRLDQQQYCGINFILKEYLNLDAEAAFQVGLDLLLGGLQPAAKKRSR